MIMKFVVIMKFGRVDAARPSVAVGRQGWPAGRSARPCPPLRPEGCSFDGTPTLVNFMITTNFMITNEWLRASTW